MSKALEALLTLSGQNTYNIDALVELLIEKGLITEEEWDAAYGNKYEQGEPSPAEWARRCINEDDGEALDAFFAKK